MTEAVLTNLGHRVAAPHRAYLKGSPDALGTASAGFDDLRAMGDQEFLGLELVYPGFEAGHCSMPLALFPADRQLPNFAAGFGVQVRLKEIELHRPRQWGACWLASHFLLAAGSGPVLGIRLLWTTLDHATLR